MGLIVNKPAPELQLRRPARPAEIPASIDPRRTPACISADPVEHGRGFVLHTTDYTVEKSSLHVSPDFSMTATVDILQDMARGEGPDRALLALGYAGWGPGQLKGGIQANGWLTAPANVELVFGARPTPTSGGAALRSISIDPRLLSTEGGRA